MLTLPAIHFKLFHTEHDDSGNTPISTEGTDQTDYLLQTNKISEAEAICKHSSVSPEVATFRFHYTTTLELLSHFSTNIVHKSEPSYASTALYLRPSLSESTAGLTEV